MTSNNLQEIERLTAKKEKEWKDAKCLQISLLTEALEEKESECLQYKDMLTELKKDFKYNLGLLQQRDKELERYDDLIIRAKTLESAHLGEISDLRIKIAKLNENLKLEQQEKCDIQRHFREQYASQQSSMEMLKASKEEQLDDIMSQLNEMKSSRERVETQLRAELEAQRFELNAEFDRKLKDDKMERKKNAEEREAEILAHELKCKFMEKELEHLKELHKIQDKSLQDAENNVSNLQRQLLESENNAKNISTVKNSRILELESKVQSLLEQKTFIVEEFEEKRKLLDKDIRIKLSNMEVVRKNFTDKERQLEGQISKLRIKAEACEQETKRTLLDMQEMQQSRESTIKLLKQQTEELEMQLLNQIESYKTSLVKKEVEIANLHEKESLLTAEIHRLNDVTKRQEKDVAEAKQKENLLLQSKVQLKLDMQQKYQEEKRQHQEETNHIVENLTKSRDDAIAELNTLKTRLRNDVLNQTGESALIVDKVMELQSQNNQLKEIIEQMSQAMQHAVEHGKETEEQTDKYKKEGDSEPTVSAEYVASLEGEVRHLKKEIRKIQELASVHAIEHILEQCNAEKNAIRESKSTDSKVVDSSDVQKKNIQPQDTDRVSYDWKLKKRLDARKQDQYVARSLKSPSKAAYLVSHLQEKLAKAVSQITLLSREKAQLLEIGNSLRSELGALHAKELQPIEHCRNENGVLEKVVGEEDSCEVDRNKLKQLEDLQYQLTKQELQFAQRDKLHKPNFQREQVHRWTVPNEKADGGIGVSMNKDENNLQFSLSTVGDASARNIWSVLDQGITSPSLPRSDEEHDRLPQPVHRKTQVRDKAKLRPQARRDRVLKIRNYNIKDDEVARRREDHKRL